MLVKTASYIKPENLAGKWVKVFLKAGGSFEMICTSSGKGYISGEDINNIDLRVDEADIGFIVSYGAEQ